MHFSDKFKCISSLHNGQQGAERSVASCGTDAFCSGLIRPREDQGGHAGATCGARLLADGCHHHQMGAWLRTVRSFLHGGMMKEAWCWHAWKWSPGTEQQKQRWCDISGADLLLRGLMFFFCHNTQTGAARLCLMFAASQRRWWEVDGMLALPRSSITFTALLALIYALLLIIDWLTDLIILFWSWSPSRHLFPDGRVWWRSPWAPLRAGDGLLHNI